MRSSLRLTAALAAGALVAFVLASSGICPFGAPAVTEAQQGGLAGAGDGGVVTETIFYRDGQGEARKANLQRLVIKVPEEYGPFVTVHGGDTNTLWFSDSRGNMRNVNVPTRLILVQREKQPVAR